MAERQKMSAAKRAKQFMPFAALKGFEEALEMAEAEAEGWQYPDGSDEVQENRRDVGFDFDS